MLEPKRGSTLEDMSARNSDALYGNDVGAGNRTITFGNERSATRIRHVVVHGGLRGPLVELHLERSSFGAFAAGPKQHLPAMLFHQPQHRIFVGDQGTFHAGMRPQKDIVGEVIWRSFHSNFHRRSWAWQHFRVTRPRIGVVGEFQPDFEPHTAIGTSVEHAQSAHVTGSPVNLEWVSTADVERFGEEDLAGYAGWWIAPGSPYRSIDGALKAIRYAREHDMPLLGTCGGYQHVVLEYARNVLGFADAAHAEYDPSASDLFITALSCSLKGQTMTVTLCDDTTAARLYHSSTVTEKYYCDFGLNPDHLPALTAAGLVVSGTDHAGEPRIVELPRLRYFVATLFVPQTSSTPGAPHPLIVGFMDAVTKRAD